MKGSITIYMTMHLHLLLVEYFTTKSIILTDLNTTILINMVIVTPMVSPISGNSAKAYLSSNSRHLFLEVGEAAMRSRTKQYLVIRETD